MRKLRNPTVLIDGKYFKVEYEKRAYNENKVEIIHVVIKKSGKIHEFYSSNYVVQIESEV